MGTCTWCDETCDKRRRWHPECAVTYLVAKGMVVHAGTGRPVIKETPCAECGLPFGTHRQGPMDYFGFEIDHELALSVAWERRRLGDARWWRAWTINNLRWLCRPCHVAKTAADRRELARLEAKVKSLDGPQGGLFDGA